MSSQNPLGTGVYGGQTSREDLSGDGGQTSREDLSGDGRWVGRNGKKLEGDGPEGGLDELGGDFHAEADAADGLRQHEARPAGFVLLVQLEGGHQLAAGELAHPRGKAAKLEIGRASCRERVESWVVSGVCR